MRWMLPWRPTSAHVSWAALLIAVAALGVALSGVAIGLPGKKVVDQNDLRKNVVRSKHIKNGQLTLADLSHGAERALTEPRAYALVLGSPDLGVDERYSRGIADRNISANNTAFCVRGVGFQPKHVEVTLQTNPDNAVPKAILDDTAACQGGTAIFFDGDLEYDEDFFVALFD
jgi:hypothetical protein